VLAAGWGAGFMVDDSDGLWLLISVVWTALLLAALLLDAVLRLFELVKNAAGPVTQRLEVYHAHKKAQDPARAIATTSRA
jgi:hypothetical protein